MSSAAAPAPSVLLQFPLVDSPRTQIVEWFEDLSAKARGLCAQWDPTGAITLIATDAVWNAIPGSITNAAQVLAGTHPPQYRAKPDFDPPAALAATATPVDCGFGKLVPRNGHAFCIHHGPERISSRTIGQRGSGQ